MKFIFEDHLVKQVSQRITAERPLNIYNWGGTQYLFRGSYRPIKEKIESLHGDIQDKEVFYFTASSTFPRLKLTDTPHKRCIKPDKATAAVVGDLTLANINGDNNLIIEFGGDYYLINSNAYVVKNHLGEQNVGGDIDVLIKYRCVPMNAKVIYKGPLFTAANANSASTVTCFMNNTFKKVVYDGELDKAVLSGKDVLDESTLDTVTSLLDSTDYSNVGLGLKLLAGLDCTKTPATALALLTTRPRISRAPEWNGVLVEQLKNTIGFKRFYGSDFYAYVYVKKEKDPKDKDLELLTMLAKKQAKEAFDKIVASYNITLTNFGMEVSYELH